MKLMAMSSSHTVHSSSLEETTSLSFLSQKARNMKCFLLSLVTFGVYTKIVCWTGWRGILMFYCACFVAGLILVIWKRWKRLRRERRLAEQNVIG